MLGTFPEGAQPSGRTPPFPLAAYDETIKAWHFTELQRTSLFPAFLKSLDVYVWWCRYCKCACLKYIIHMNINVKLYSMYMDVQCPCMYMDGCHTSQWSDDGGGDEIALTSRCCCSRGKKQTIDKIWFVILSTQSPMIQNMLFISVKQILKFAEIGEIFWSRYILLFVQRYYSQVDFSNLRIFDMLIHYARVVITPIFNPSKV